MFKMSKTVLNVANLDMLRSLYDFQATYAKTLSFRTNDYFILHQTVTKHKNWWEVINERGEMGFIPSNYVQTVTVSPGFYLQYLDSCMALVMRNDLMADQTRKDALSRLRNMKRNVEQLPEVRAHALSSDAEDNIPPLMFTDSEGQLKPMRESASTLSVVHRGNEGQGDADTAKDNSVTVVASIVKESTMPMASTTGSHNETSLHGDEETPAITATAVYELVDSVRVNTQLSYHMSRAAVATVIHGLHDLLPAAVFPYLSTVQSLLEATASENTVVDGTTLNKGGSNVVVSGSGGGGDSASANVVQAAVIQTHDAARLQIIFEELTSCRQDEQQRSWMLHEDEMVIREYLNELISILTNADAKVSRLKIAADRYSALQNLIEYYQMETRWSIRQLLLQAFGVMCGLDDTVISIVVNSVLPCEIARDMQDNSRFIAKLSYSAVLLTMAFSMAEPMPVTHQTIVGIGFVKFLLRLIEDPPETDEDEQIPDLFLTLILAFNLQFSCENITENPVICALSEMSTAKTFTEKSLLLLNRDEDPVRIFDHEPEPPQSMLKLFVDVFQTAKTSHLYYTNDVRVLTDIVVRNILDLSPRDKRRHQYIILCRLILRNTNYSEHCHRLDDIIKCFNRIFCEDGGTSEADQKLLREISAEFPEHFLYGKDLC